MKINSLNGLYFEVQNFKAKAGCEDQDLMIIMNEKFKPDEGHYETLFGIELLFSKYVEDVLIARKFSPKFLGLEKEL